VCFNMREMLKNMTGVNLTHGIIIKCV
jgi:hypothetical protein